MFVREKKNKSGIISVQIIDKSGGKYKVLKTIGSSSNKNAVNELVIRGKEWIKNYYGQLTFDLYQKKDEIFREILSGIRQINVSGTELLLGKIFDEIGFNIIKDEIFRKLVISRLIFPASKLKTVDFINKYQSIQIDEDKVYRYLDKLYNTQKEQIQQISYLHTLKILNNKISIVFYDVTTLYFEIDNEDELKKRGFSKEGKHHNPQIILGLLVSAGGYPLAYEIFEGNKFEGHTMLPIIDKFKEKYDIKKLVIIADSGLLSSNNIEQLLKNDYEFILGARIKNEKSEIKKQIIGTKISNGESITILKDEKLKLIVSYSDKRATKDKLNREKGLKKLEKQLKSGKLTKQNINNRGYNKYLKMDGEIKITIDNEKFEADSSWDGLKGYLTNTDLNKDQIIENYGNLWKIEQAFRISKHELKIRPIYHRLQRRIEAHISISFASFKIYKELERQLKNKNSNLSPEKAIEIAKTIYSITIFNPTTQKSETKNLLLTEEQKNLAKLFEF